MVYDAEFFKDIFFLLNWQFQKKILRKFRNSIVIE